VNVIIEKANKTINTRATTASLEHMTGPARGTVSWLFGPVLDVSLSKNEIISISECNDDIPPEGTIARLRHTGDSYHIEACSDFPLWINGKRVTEKQLVQRDLIEFGDTGPLSRYQLHWQGGRLRKSVTDMLIDFADYARVSRKPKMQRLIAAFRDFFHDFVLETTVFFRLSVIAALIILFVVAFQQNRSSRILQQQAESSALQLESFARTLTRTNEEILRPADLNKLRQELSHSLSAAAERLDILEKRSDASTRIIAEATRSIVFLQGSYGFRDTESERMLRYLIDDEGHPLFSLRGQPLFTLEGEGEIAKRQFTGTAFVVSANGTLLTNRHVALPWEVDTGTLITELSLQPELIKFIGYLPDKAEPFPVQLLKASDDADLAVLSANEIANGLSHLVLTTAKPKPGDEVVVMGYPTGLRSMLAQTGDAFLAELENDNNLDFWTVAERLAQSQFIRPLASRGIVGQLTSATIVYDAETTHGGSGGPVLDINGGVVAINTAIIPEYGGSNFGIPVEHARPLLAEIGIE
jgi:serine protease Do